MGRRNDFFVVLCQSNFWKFLLWKLSHVCVYVEREYIMNTQLQQIVTWTILQHLYLHSFCLLSLDYCKANPREPVIPSINTTICMPSFAFLCALQLEDHLHVCSLLLGAHYNVISEHLLICQTLCLALEVLSELRKHTRTKPRCSKPRITKVPDSTACTWEPTHTTSNCTTELSGIGFPFPRRPWIRTCRVTQVLQQEALQRRGGNWSLRSTTAMGA